MNFTSQKFIVTKIRKPKSVYISELGIEEGSVLQVEFTMNLYIYISNISKNVTISYDKSALKRIFGSTGCIEFIEIQPQQLIENSRQQSTVSL